MREYYLQLMGIESWVLRETKVNKQNLADLALKVSSCMRCPLHETRKQTVFARGNSSASLMIIGEAPGYDEDQQGLPFVGKAWGLLNKMLISVGLSEENVYIANVLKCRPPDNRDPNAKEINQCCDYLAQQITLVAPKLILAVGLVAGQFLLKATLPLNKMRQKVHEYNGTPLLVSYHPAYLLRNPADKRNAYSDLMFAKSLLGHGG